MNKNLMIGLGVLAVAGIGLYMWKRRKDEKKSSSDEKKSNARGFITTYEQSQIGSDVIKDCDPSSGIGNMTFPCKYGSKIYKNYNQFMTS